MLRLVDPGVDTRVDVYTPSVDAGTPCLLSMNAQNQSTNKYTHLTTPTTPITTLALEQTK